MDATEFVFGVDLDGVVADFIQGLKPIAAEWLGVPVASLTDEVSYGFKEWNIGDADAYNDLHRFALKERALFASLPLIDGAAPALRRISARGVRIRIITHRLYIQWFHRQAVVQTVEWLEKHGIPYWDLCFMAAKSSVDADVYVEDSPANIRALRDVGRRSSSSATRRTGKSPRRVPPTGLKSSDGCWGSSGWSDVDKLGHRQRIDILHTSRRSPGRATVA
jgi:beta-phosphoglucomutase-like phosphatase (HAD superfamily)